MKHNENPVLVGFDNRKTYCRILYSYFHKWLNKKINKIVMR